MTASSNTSVAPLAKAIASGCAHMSGKRGEVMYNSLKPILAIARATWPTLPGWLVRTRMMRMDLSQSVRVFGLLVFVCMMGYLFECGRVFCYFSKRSRVKSAQYTRKLQ